MINFDIMAKKQEKSEINALLRLPMALHQALKKKAVNSRRSLHGEMLYRLEGSLKIGNFD